jgi:hypothetical protein
LIPVRMLWFISWWRHHRLAVALGHQLCPRWMTPNVRGAYHACNYMAVIIAHLARRRKWVLDITGSRRAGQW